MVCYEEMWRLIERGQGAHVPQTKVVLWRMGFRRPLLDRTGQCIVQLQLMCVCPCAQGYDIETRLCVYE